MRHPVHAALLLDTELLASVEAPVVRCLPPSPLVGLSPSPRLWPCGSQSVLRSVTAEPSHTVSPQPGLLVPHTGTCARCRWGPHRCLHPPCSPFRPVGWFPREPPRELLTGHFLCVVTPCPSPHGERETGVCNASSAGPGGRGVHSADSPGISWAPGAKTTVHVRAARHCCGLRGRLFAALPTTWAVRLGRQQE